MRSRAQGLPFDPMKNLNPGQFLAPEQSWPAQQFGPSLNNYPGPAATDSGAPRQQDVHELFQGPEHRYRSLKLFPTGQIVREAQQCVLLRPECHQHSDLLFQVEETSALLPASPEYVVFAYIFNVRT